jgi:hypothetical protein
LNPYGAGAIFRELERGWNFKDFRMVHAAEHVHQKHGSNPVYGHVSSKADIDRIFAEIRDDLSHAGSRATLTELYRRAGYLITLTYAPSWEDRFGDKAASLRHEAEVDFRKLVKQLNAKAERIGEKGDYDENWGKMKD